MRVLVPLLIVLSLLLIVLSLAAACGGGGQSTLTTSPSSRASARATIGLTPTPTVALLSRLATAFAPTPDTTFAPIEETLIPPPDIDTSSWLLYHDDVQGFELMYPPDGRVKRNVEDYLEISQGNDIPGTRIDLPVVPGTTLEEKYMFVRVTDAPAGSCLPPAILSARPPVASKPDVAIIHSGGMQFWRTHGTSHVASSHAAGEIGYWTSHGSACVTLVGVLYSVSPGVFSTPPPSPNRDEELKVFTAIVATFRWTQP